MTAAERRDLRALVEALRAEMRDEIAGIKARLDLLEKPKVAKVLFDQGGRPVEPGGGTAR
jgi:hypothetical protein